MKFETSLFLHQHSYFWAVIITCAMLWSIAISTTYSQSSLLGIHLQFSFHSSCPCTATSSNRPLPTSWRAGNHCSNGSGMVLVTSTACNVSKQLESSCLNHLWYSEVHRASVYFLAGDMHCIAGNAQYFSWDTTTTTRHQASRSLIKCPGLLHTVGWTVCNAITGRKVSSQEKQMY